MPAQGICLRVTHTGAVATALLVTDIHDGIDSNGRVQARKPGPVYIPVGGFVDLVYTSQVALSFESGAIREWIDIGYLTAAFVFGPTFAAEGSVIVEEAGVVVEAEAKTLNFTGPVTATSSAPNTVDITVVGAGGSIVVEDDGAVVEALATVLDFGSGVSAVSTGGGQVEISTSAFTTVTTAVDRVASDKEFIIVNGSSVVITLPAPSADVHVGIKVAASTITNIEVRTNAAGVLIDGTDYSAVGLPLTTQWEMVNVISDGTDWFIF